MFAQMRSAPLFLLLSVVSQLAGEGPERVATSDLGAAVVTLPDDWVTQGQWPGRYGQRFWILCGMSGRWHYTGQAYGFSRRAVRDGHRLVSMPISPPLPYQIFIGTNAAKGDGLRAWIHWPTLPLFPPAESEDQARKPAESVAPTGMRPWNRHDVPKVLINPVTGLRRQADIDDHAEAYQPWLFRQGPHLYVQLEVPDGPHVVAFYFMNKDGDQHVNRIRTSAALPRTVAPPSAQYRRRSRRHSLP